MSQRHRSSETPLCDVVIDTFVDLHRRRQSLPFMPHNAIAVPAVAGAAAVGGAVAVGAMVGPMDQFLYIDQSLCRCVEMIVNSECDNRRYSHEAGMFDKVLKFFLEWSTQLYKLLPSLRVKVNEPNV